MFFISFAIGLVVITVTSCFLCFSRRRRREITKENELVQTSSSAASPEHEDNKYKYNNRENGDTDVFDSEPNSTGSDEIDGKSSTPENIRTLPSLELSLSRKSANTNIENISIPTNFPPPVPPKPKKKGSLVRQAGNFSFERSDSDNSVPDVFSPVIFNDNDNSTLTPLFKERATLTPEDVCRNVSVKKLALNLKINPLALLPNRVRIPSLKQIIMADSENSDKSQLKSHQELEIISTEPEILTHISKYRPKILAPRHPPTRKQKGVFPPSSVESQKFEDNVDGIDNKVELEDE